MKKIFAFVIMFAFIFAIVGCKSTSNEKTTGEEIEETTDEVGDDIEEGAEEVGDEAQEVGEDIEEGAQAAGDEIESWFTEDSEFEFTDNNTLEVNKEGDTKTFKVEVQENELCITEGKCWQIQTEGNQKHITIAGKKINLPESWN